MDAREVRYREAEERLWGSLGVVPIERRIRLRQTGCTVRVQELGEGPAALFIHGASLDDGRIGPAAIEAYAALLRHTPTQRNDLRLGRLFLSPVHGLKRGILLSPGERAAIRSRVRFIWGDADPFGGPEIARGSASAFTEADLVIVPGGHAPWMDDPGSAAPLVADFLAGPTPVSAASGGPPR